MTWDDAMWTYGNDKPDIRFGMTLANLKSPLKATGFSGEEKTGFGVFDNAETLVAIAIPGAAEYSRKQTTN
jgi:aspartyl-tRNA synthetase